LRKTGRQTLPVAVQVKGQTHSADAIPGLRAETAVFKDIVGYAAFAAWARTTTCAGCRARPF